MLIFHAKIMTLPYNKLNTTKGCWKFNMAAHLIKANFLLAMNQQFMQLLLQPIYVSFNYFLKILFLKSFLFE